MTHFAAVAVLTLLVIATGCRKGKSDDRRRQVAVIRQFRRLPEPSRVRAEIEFKASGVDLPKTLAEFDRDPTFQLAAPIELRTQSVIDRDLVPVPILNGAFQPVRPQPPNESAPVLLPDQQLRILAQAMSVGRLEVANGQTYQFYGTGFVAGRNAQSGLIATNCHVIDDRTLTPAIPDGISGSAIPGGVRFQIDFDDSPAHNDSRTFLVQWVMPCGATGLDAALLIVNGTSVDGVTQLPNPLSLSASPLGNNFAGGDTELIGIVGYPMLASADPKDADTAIFANFDPTKYAKFYSPGAITLIERNSGIDFLLHNASTMPGYSGSPLLDLALGNTVGVHSCCSSTGGPVPTSPSFLPCAQKLLAPQLNFSLSSWSVRTDSALKKTLQSFGVL